MAQDSFICAQQAMAALLQRLQPNNINELWNWKGHGGFLIRLYWDFLDKCSYVGRVWGIYFFCWSDLTAALDLAVKPRQVCPLAPGPGDAPGPGQEAVLECQTPTRTSRVPSYSKWFQWLQDVWSEMKRLLKNHLDGEKSSCLRKYPAEFLLENNLMCKVVSFPDYEEWDLREKCLILQT